MVQRCPDPVAKAEEVVEAGESDFAGRVSTWAVTDPVPLSAAIATLHRNPCTEMQYGAQTNTPIDMIE